MHALKIEWPNNAQEAIALQGQLRGRVKLQNDFKRLKTVAGVDVSYDIKSNVSRAVIVLMDLNDLEPRFSTIAHAPTTFPYIPGLLSFREIPVILKALNCLPEKPDLLMVDGQGVAHPRRLGIAAHLGVVTDIPAIGVAKSRLTGFYKMPGLKKGAQSELKDRGEKIGTVLRSKDNVAPLFISPGHRIDFDAAVKITEQCLRRHRLPEPTRIADLYSKIKPQTKRPPGEGGLFASQE